MSTTKQRRKEQYLERKSSSGKSSPRLNSQSSLHRYFIPLDENTTSSTTTTTTTTISNTTRPKLVQRTKPVAILTPSPKMIPKTTSSKRKEASAAHKKDHHHHHHPYEEQQRKDDVEDDDDDDEDDDENVCLSSLLSSKTKTNLSTKRSHTYDEIEQHPKNLEECTSLSLSTTNDVAACDKYDHENCHTKRISTKCDNSNTFLGKKRQRKEGIQELQSSSSSCSSSNSNKETYPSYCLAKVPSLRRYVAHTAMDYIPSTSSSSTSSFLNGLSTTNTRTTHGKTLNRLVQREMTGCRPWPANLCLSPFLKNDLESVPKSSTSHQNDMVNTTSTDQSTIGQSSSTKVWKKLKWVQLQSPSLPFTSSSTVSEIVEMTWDPQGTLLAVAYSKHIAIYDWDTIRAADQQGRADWQRLQHLQQADEQEWSNDLSKIKEDTRQKKKKERKKKLSRFNIPPTLVFAVPYSISKIAWDPLHTDQLAVGFKVVGQTFLYALDRVVTWQDEQQRKQRHHSYPSNDWNNNNNHAADHLSSRFPPQYTYTALFPSRKHQEQRQQLQQNQNVNHGTVLNILFLNCNNNTNDDTSNVIVNLGHSVYAWKNGILQWRFQSSALNGNSPCTYMASLHHKGWILIATQSGRMYVVDSRRKERSALALQEKPVILQEWSMSMFAAATKKTDPLLSQKIVNLRVTTIIGPIRRWVYVTSDGFIRQGQMHLKDITEPSQPSSVSSIQKKRKKITHLGSIPMRSHGMFAMGGSSHKTRHPLNRTIKGKNGTHSCISLGPTKVLYTPPKIALYNAQGESIGLDSRAYSTPPSQQMISHVIENSFSPLPPSSSLSSSTVPYTSFPSALVFPQVTQLSKYLGHHDKYVQDGGPKIRRNISGPHRWEIIPNCNAQDSARIVFSLDKELCCSSTLEHGNQSQLPPNLVIHPSMEWMVVADTSGSKLTLMVNR